MGTTDEWNEVLNKLTEAWQQFAATIQQMGEALSKIFGSVNTENSKRSKSSGYYNRYFRKKKDDYLRNQISMYKIERRIQKHLPYQRRNY